MAASIGFYESDETTPLTSLDMGAVPPGSDYFTRYGAYKEIRAKNDGTENFATVNVEIQQRLSDVHYTYLRIAQGAGTPGAFQDYTANPLALGGLNAGIAATVWVDAIVPVAAAAVAGKGNLALLATI